MLRTILSQSLLYFLAMYMPVVANIFILPLINKHLSAEDYAIYGLTYGYIGILSGFSDLGLTNLLQNSYYKQREQYKEIWAQFLGFLQLYRLFYGALVATLLYVLFKNRIDSEILPYYIAMVGIPVLIFDFTKTIGVRHCQFENRHSMVYTTTLVSGILTLVITYYTIAVLKLGFIGWFISAFVAKAFEFAYYGIYLHYFQGIRPDFRFSRALLKEKIFVSLPLIPKRYSSYLINNADRAMLDFFRASAGSVTMAQIGLYNIGYNFANYFGSFHQAVNTVVSPIFFKLLAEKGEKEKEAGEMLKNVTMLWYSAALLSGLGLCLWLKEIIAFLYPKPEFHDAYKYGILIIMALCYRPIYVATIDRAIFHEKTKAMLKIAFVAGMLNVVLNLLAIPFFGIQGAVATSFISYVYMGFSGFYVKEIRAYILEDYKPLLLLAVLLGSSALAFAVMDLPISWKLVVTLFLMTVTGIWYFLRGRHQIRVINTIRMS
jgi:O-antigen/teichoic acid export membrane protein